MLPTPVTDPSSGNGHARDLASEGKLLPTPLAHDAVDGKTMEQVLAMRERTGAGVSNLNEVAANELAVLFPTPTVAIATGGNARRGGDRSEELLLPGIATSLMPTPTENMLRNEDESIEDWEARRAAVKATGTNGNGFGMPLTKAMQFLPTPLTTDNNQVGPADANRDTVQLRAIEYLLPTPTTQESHSGPSQAERNTPPLNARVLLLPTPLASEEQKVGQQNSEERSKTGQVFLGNVINDVAQGVVDERGHLDPTSDGELVDWGKYRAAIKRAEAVLGRMAPSPTKPDGKNGNRRLSSKLVEFMMLLPEGWVVGNGLKRNDELARLGNGVVPIQAAVATALGIRRLLESRRTL